MIIARSPLRISLGGGGTDLPSYYDEHGGELIAAAIDKYVYVSITETFLDHLLIRYSRIEEVARRQDVAHPIIREALDYLQVEDVNIEITTMADIPAGTGLGSSGSFATALLAALHRYTRRFSDNTTLARVACEIEIERLGEPVGKQDQYIAAMGGVSSLQFHPGGEVTHRPLGLGEDALERLRQNLLLFSTGITRSAGTILAEQKRRTVSRDDEMVKNLHEVKRIGIESRDAIEAGDVRAYGALLHEHWLLKKKRSQAMSSSKIDGWYEAAMKAGGLGGKIIGAGGGGFLLVCTESPGEVRRAMADLGLPELKYDFSFSGTSIIST